MTEWHGPLTGLLVGLLACASTGQRLVTPRVQEIDLRKLPTSPVWTPGSPVREVPDLKRSEGARGPAVTLGGHTIQVVDRSLVVLAGGRQAAGPFAFGSLWPAGADPCGVDVEWPPVVTPDREAGRWLIWRRFQGMPDGSVPFCIAVSRTADPIAGGWWLYDFSLPPHRYEGHDIDVSTDAYRLAGKPGEGGVQIAFDRSSMLAGRPASFAVATR